jgi:hypothetical protein
MTETKQLTKDRNYYRMISDAGLIALCKHIELTELEVVLAERLVVLAERLKEARRLHHV